MVVVLCWSRCFTVCFFQRAVGLRNGTAVLQQKILDATWFAVAELTLFPAGRRHVEDFVLGTSHACIFPSCVDRT